MDGVREDRRELPARHAGPVSLVLGNTVIVQWLAQSGQVTLLEEMQAASHRLRRAGYAVALAHV